MYAQLGNIVFENLIGFTDWDRALSVSYARQKLLQAKPRLAFTGYELTELKIGVRFHRGFCVPEEEIAALEDAMNNKFVMPLVFGNGRIIGDFVIEKIQERLRQTDRDGNVTDADYTLNLTEYYIPDREKLLGEAAKESAIAVSANNPKAVRGVLQGYNSDAGRVAYEVVNASIEAQETDRLVNEAAARPELEPHNSNKIKKSMDRMLTALGVANTLLQGGDPWTTIAPFLPADLANCVNLGINMQSAMPISNINSVLSINNSLQASIAQSKLSAAPLNGAFAFRKI